MKAQVSRRISRREHPGDVRRAVSALSVRAPGGAALLALRRASAATASAETSGRRRLEHRHRGVRRRRRDDGAERPGVRASNPLGRPLVQGRRSESRGRTAQRSDGVHDQLDADGTVDAVAVTFSPRTRGSLLRGSRRGRSRSVLEPRGGTQAAAPALRDKQRWGSDLAARRVPVGGPRRDRIRPAAADLARAPPDLQPDHGVAPARRGGSRAAAIRLPPPLNGAGLSPQGPTNGRGCGVAGPTAAGARRAGAIATDADTCADAAGVCWYQAMTSASSCAGSFMLTLWPALA
jgi:hypothetical protein